MKVPVLKIRSPNRRAWTCARARSRRTVGILSAIEPSNSDKRPLPAEEYRAPRRDRTTVAIIIRINCCGNVTEAENWGETANFRRNRNEMAGFSGPADTLQSTHIRPQNLRYRHAAVFVLVVFEHRDHRPRQRQAGAVQRMHEFGLDALGLEAN